MPKKPSYSEKVKFLRNLGYAPKVDLRSVSKLSPQKKSAITRAFNAFGEKYDFYSQHKNTEGLLDFVPTKDKELLKLASKIWAPSNIVDKGPYKGFYVPKGRFFTRAGKTQKPYVSTLPTGEKVIVRPTGSQKETYIDSPTDPKQWKKYGAQEIDRLVEAVQSKAGAKGARVGFVVDQSIGKRFYKPEELRAKLNQYLPSLSGKNKGDRTLTIRSVIFVEQE